MATASAQSTRTRRTASREADALAGERAHMLIWRSGMKQLDVAAAIGIEPTAFGKRLHPRRRRRDAPLEQPDRREVRPRPG